MFLLSTAGANASLDLNDEAWVALVDAAALFLRAGGVLTPHDWRDLHEIERVALAQAADTMRLDTAIAANDVPSAEALYWHAGGEEQHIATAVSAALDTAQERLGRHDFAGRTARSG